MRNSSRSPTNEGCEYIPVHVLEETAHKEHPQIVHHGIQVTGY